MPVAPAARLSSSRTLTSTRELGFGDSGAAVTELQQLLQRAGVPTGPIDGDFGQMTQAAVRRFQASRGLPVDGIAGELTFGALRRTSTPTAPGGPSQPLRQGDFGADVQKLQRSLARHGFFTDVDGQFGSDTRAKVVQFQRAKGLNADGVVNAATWRALESAPAAPTPPAAGSRRQRILDAARGELGTLESGNNRGAALKYPQSFGRGAEAWCADFASWVMQRSGGRMNDPYCPSVVNQLKRDGNWKGTSNPQPGDLVLFDWDRDGTADHIGIVERVNADGSIGTIEGNTENPQTGQEGVWRRTRSMGTVLGFGNPY
jgi:peptidoglycan hydrolase-like protein with peptidoglycan-binding domain